MMQIFVAILVFVAAVGVALGIPKPDFPKAKVVLGGAVLAFFIAIFGAVSYNNAGYCSHIRTLFGTESMKCNVGWYFSGWGTMVEWPHSIAIQHLPEVEKEVITESSAVYKVKGVRLADNWSGDVTQTTRFNIPTSDKEFLRMVNEFRTPERLIQTALVPAVIAAIDTTANLFTMEEYYAGGMRDAFKKEFFDTISLGPALTEQINDPQQLHRRVSANSTSDVTADTNEVVAETEIKIVEKKKDATGQDIRPNKNYFSQYGIVVTSATIQDLDPDQAYEDQIKLRKEAISRRVIARDQRLEQDEQRLLTISKSETEISKRQGEARVKQIEQTTDAETTKKLALIKANQQTEQAAIEKKTAEINLETTEINAKATIVSAEADAKARQLAITADNALKTKIDAEIEIQKVWAEAFANRKVPQIVFGGGKDGAPVGANDEVQTFFNLMNAQAAKSLSYDRSLENNIKN